MNDKIMKAALEIAKKSLKASSSALIKNNIFSTPPSERAIMALVGHLHKEPVTWQGTRSVDFPYKTTVPIGGHSMDVFLKLGDFPEESLYRAVLADNKNIVLAKTNGFFENWDREIAASPKP